MKRDVLKTVDEILLAALANDNRNCHAQRFTDRSHEKSTRVRTATGNVTSAGGNLPV